MRALLFLAALPLLLVPMPEAAGQDAVAAVNPVSVQWIESEFLMSSPGSPSALDILKVEVNRPGKHPLALLTHGTSNDPIERSQVTPWSYLPQAIWFARRGYVVLVVVREGYGRSSGEPDLTPRNCPTILGGGFAESGNKSASNLRAAIKYAETLPEVDTGTIVSAGVSSGGFAQVALTVNPPPGLKAAINFAGGRGSDGKLHNCNEPGIVAAFHDYGMNSRVPMLWIYAENDHWFPPELAQRFDVAFRKGGGIDEFVMAPPYSDEGHHFFTDVNGWSPIVEGFLKEKGLLPLPKLLPEPDVAYVPPPPGLSNSGLAAFHNFLMYGPQKAFATNGRGGWGMATGMFNQELADKRALDNCTKNAKNPVGCAIVFRGTSK
jgi:dienelactone hydrolase